MLDSQELWRAKAIIESFAPRYPVALSKPLRIGTRSVAVWAIPIQYVNNEQLIEVRVV